MRETRITSFLLILLTCVFVCSNAFVPSTSHMSPLTTTRHDATPRAAHFNTPLESDDSPKEHLSNDATLKIVRDFCAQVKQSLDDETFCSLAFKGPTIPKKKRQDTATKERLRGCIRQIQARLITLPKRRNNKTCLQATIKYHGATDVAKNYKIDQVVPGLTSLLLSNDSGAVASEWGDNTIHPCGTELGIQNGLLETTLGSWHLTSSHAKPMKLTFQKNTHSNNNNKSSINTTPSPMSHDRIKKVPVSTKASFLQALGLTKPDGKPRPAMSSKLKQCQKFVEIVSNLIASIHNGKETIDIVDMGCGRAYLTFSLHSYLVEKYGDTVYSCGIDMRPKLVKEISGIARSLGSDFDGLTFQEGTIDRMLDSSLSTSDDKNTNSSSSLNVLIALHACDTATDDALWSGIQRGCDVIVVAPCCHKQVRRQLDRYYTEFKSEHPLADVLRHGIYRERIAETVTDSLRAILLELVNYTVQVFEFIGGEHTGKNVMITAVKRKRSRSQKELATMRERFRDLASLHGVHDQRLASWMDSSLLLDQSEDQSATTRKPKRIPLSSREMPPISIKE